MGSTLSRSSDTCTPGSVISSDEDAPYSYENIEATQSLAIKRSRSVGSRIVRILILHQKHETILRDAVASRISFQSWPT